MPRPRKDKMGKVEAIEEGKFEFLSLDRKKNFIKVKWRELIDESFLYVNENYYTTRGKDIPENISDAEDDGVVVRIIGLRDLAHRHGFKSITYRPSFIDNNSCVIRCKIVWEPTSYNNYREVITEGIASVNPDNAFGIGLKFKEANASNRAFARAVRDYFCIFSVCEEELNKPDILKNQGASSKPAVRPGNLRSNRVLEKTVSTLLDMDTFFEFKKRFVFENLEMLGLDESFSQYEKYEDIPADLCKKLTAEIRKWKKSKDIVKAKFESEPSQK